MLSLPAVVCAGSACSGLRLAPLMPAVCCAVFACSGDGAKRKLPKAQLLYLAGSSEHVRDIVPADLVQDTLRVPKVRKTG